MDRILRAPRLQALTDVASDHVIQTENEDDSGSEDEESGEIECTLISARARRARAKKKVESGSDLVDMSHEVDDSEAQSPGWGPPPPDPRDGKDGRQWPAVYWRWYRESVSAVTETRRAVSDFFLGCIADAPEPSSAAAAADPAAAAAAEKKLLGGGEKSKDHHHIHGTLALRDKLSSEQDLFCSSCAMLVVSFLLWRQSDFSILPPSLQVVRVFELDDNDSVFQTEADVAYILCILAGMVYALAMMSVMKAWEHVPSTIVVPLMQLSGPMVEIMEACLGSVARKRGRGRMGVLAPVAHATLTHKDFFAFALITVGGLTPSTESLPQLFKIATWRRPSMSLLVLANVLYSMYFVMLALCVGDDTSRDPRERRALMEETQFVVISNLSSVTFLAALFALTPRLRRHMRALRNVTLKTQLISGFAEFTNYFSMLLLTSAYQLHYSSGLVTAARTGLNQFINVIFALALYSAFKIGRPVKNLRKKLIAAAVVCAGLFISAE